MKKIIFIMIMILSLTLVSGAYPYISSGSGGTSSSYGWTNTSTAIYTTDITDKVGIGTTEPISKFSVVGGNVSFGDNHATSLSSGGIFEISFPGENNLFVMNSSGVATKTNSIHFYSDRASVGQLMGGFRWINGASSVNDVAAQLKVLRGTTDTKGSLELRTSGTTALTINEDGNVGIGITNPTSLLYVSGDEGEWIQSIKNTNAAGNGLFIQYAGTASSDYGFGVFDGIGFDFSVRGGGEIYAIDVYSDTVTSGKVLSIQSDGKIGYDASTIRIKENLRPLNDASWIYSDSVQPYTYDLKDPMVEENQTGLIAEYLEEVNPNCVYYDANYTTNESIVAGVNYNCVMMGMLVEIRNLNTEIETLKSTNLFDRKNVKYTTVKRTIQPNFLTRGNTVLNLVEKFEPELKEFEIVANKAK